MINKIIALFKQEPVPQKPMATRKPKCETDEFDALINSMTLEDFKELEALNNE